MRRKFKRVFGLLILLATLAAIGFGGAYLFSGVMFRSVLWALITGTGTALVASIIINWLGFRLIFPREYSSQLRKTIADVVLPVALSATMLFGFILFVYIGIDIFYYNQNGFSVFVPEALQAAQVGGVIFACVMLLAFAVIVDWLGFRVAYKPEEDENNQLEKQKRVSRVDALFANLSDAEIHELRQRLLAEQDTTSDNPLCDEAMITEADWYAEKSKRRLQTER